MTIYVYVPVYLYVCGMCVYVSVFVRVQNIGLKNFFVREVSHDFATDKNIFHFCYLFYLKS